MRWHRRAIPGNGDYRRDSNARTGEALASLGRARHWQSEVKFGTGLALLSVGIVMTSTLQHRNGKQRPSSDGAAQHSEGIGRSSSAMALKCGVQRGHGAEGHCFGKSTASNRRGMATKRGGGDLKCGGEARLWAPMRRQSAGMKRFATANRSRPTRGQGKASRGVASQSKGKAERSLGEARRDTALAEQIVARPGLASNESIQH